MPEVVIHVAYLFAAALFIFGLKMLSSPKSARQGNFVGATGMLLAVVITLLATEIASFTIILAGLLIGAAIGAVFARTVKMTAMPQMVALLNGFGGAASGLVALVEYLRLTVGGGAIATELSISVMLGIIIGSVTLSGSLVAFAKLQELVSGAPVLFRFQHGLNLILFLATLVIAGVLIAGGASPGLIYAVLFLSLLLGVLLVIPIGGADMPVVISLLNSYSGLAGSAAGFVVGNTVLIISGALVGAAGLILTSIMCRAMNRSLTNVVFGGFGAESAAGGAGGEEGTVRSITAEEGAIVLGYAKTVVFVPGYGLAVAQAQHQLRELADALESRGVEVKYAIHPVAGRMPGHMNVLLAEADVPYDKLLDMDDINPEFPHTDAVVVVGANDVVNPSARNDPSSPIYGMPILDVDKARNVIVLKRSMSPGFAGIQNPLFFLENTMMLFGDAKASIVSLLQEVKDL